MEYVTIAIGLFIMAMGFLVKKYPNLIAGYSKVSSQRKGKVDINGLSSWIRNGLVIVGVITIVGYYVLNYFGFKSLANNITIITVVGGVFIIAAFAEHYIEDGPE